MIRKIHKNIRGLCWSNKVKSRRLLYFIFILYPIYCWDLACLVYSLNTVILCVGVCLLLFMLRDDNIYIWYCATSLLRFVSGEWNVNLTSTEFHSCEYKKNRLSPTKFTMYRRPYLRVTRWTRSVLEVHQSVLPTTLWAVNPHNRVPVSDMGTCSCPMHYVGGPLTPHREGPSWEANSISASQEIPRFIWKPKVHCRMHKSLSLVWFTVHAIPSSVKSIPILSSPVRVGHTNGLFPSGSRPKPCIRSLVPHTCHMPSSSHSAWFLHPNTAWCTIQIAMKLLIMQFSPVSSYFLPRRLVFLP